MGLNHSKVKSFSYAFMGIKEAFKAEPNLRTHTLIAALVIIFAAVLKFNITEWVLLVITIFFVLILELLNTAFESLVDLISPEIKKEAKIAKDVSASVVLLGSILSVIVGMFLFVPKILKLL